ncbi:MAG: rhamnulokinase [Lachnospiraceae bacterium]|nr:rhamnulokinase [Lachnospiraceae bacterium]
MKRHLAIDMGASSMRGIVGWMENGTMQIEEVYRLPHEAIMRGGHMCWEMEPLYEGILESLRQCKAKGLTPDTLGIDTWGVDYVLLDENDQILGDSVAYRDSRTDGMDRVLEEKLPFEEHYAISGIAKQPFNTVYQLMAQFKEHPEHKEQAKSFLMVPDYLGFLLTGVKKNEYTNCSTTAMLDARTKNWSPEILKAAGIPEELFAEKPAEPGTVLGVLRPEMEKELGYNVTVILPATHDTGSAFVAVPAKDENAVYLSSGTWSLLGVELDQPVTDVEALNSGFTNEGGYDGRNGKIRFLKNIMGLWILQNIQKELKGAYSFGEMADLAAKAADYAGSVDVNDNRFLAPSNMTEEIKAALKEKGYQEPTLEELLSCVNHGLATCYADAIAQLEQMLNKKFTSINIVGGGSQNVVLNQWTATACGLPTYAGPSEGTALGNLMIQMIYSGEFASLQEARDAIRKSFAIKEIRP